MAYPGFFLFCLPGSWVKSRINLVSSFSRQSQGPVTSPIPICCHQATPLLPWMAATASFLSSQLLSLPFPHPCQTQWRLPISIRGKASGSEQWKEPPLSCRSFHWSMEYHPPTLATVWHPCHLLPQQTQTPSTFFLTLLFLLNTEYHQ